MKKSEQEYGEICHDCGNTGGPTFARYFYRKINKKWMRLCSNCWNAHNSPNTINPAVPKNLNFGRSDRIINNYEIS